MEEFTDNFTPGPWRTWAPLGESLYAWVLAPDSPVTGPIKRADAVRIVKCFNPLMEIQNELLDDCTITAVTPQMVEEFFQFIGGFTEKIDALNRNLMQRDEEMSELRRQLDEARQEIDRLKKPKRPPFQNV